MAGAAVLPRILTYAASAALATEERHLFSTLLGPNNWISCCNRCLKKPFDLVEVERFLTLELLLLLSKSLEFL